MILREAEDTVETAREEVKELERQKQKLLFKNEQLQTDIAELKHLQQVEQQKTLESVAANMMK